MCGELNSNVRLGWYAASLRPSRIANRTTTEDPQTSYTNLKPLLLIAPNLGEAYIFDQVNARITQFDTLGTVKQVFEMPESMISRPPRKVIVESESASSWMLYRSLRNSSIVHKHNEKGEPLDDGLFEVDHIWNTSVPIEMAHSSYSPGTFALDPRGKIIYAPSVYRGKLFQIDLTSDDKLLEILYGSATVEEVLTLVENQPYPKWTYVHKKNSEVAAAIINVESVGLFYLENLGLVHFSRRIYQGLITYHVEYFDSTGKLLQTGKLQGPNWLKSGYLRFEHFDESGSLYVLDISDQSLLRVASIEMPTIR